MEQAPVLHNTLYGNTVYDWIFAAGIAAGTFAMLRLILSMGIRDLRMLADKVRLGSIDPLLEALENTNVLVLTVLSLYAGSENLNFTPHADKMLRITALAAVVLQTGLWGSAIVDAWLRRYRAKYLATNPTAVTTMSAMSFMIKAGVWIFLALLVMENAGLNVSALVTGLGIGGIAVALAVQHILVDLFGSLTIMLDKPFMVGDSLTVGDYQGTVEHVGLKTTRIRSLSGEQIILSNSDLLGSRIRNYGRMFERRLQVDILVTYATTREQLKLIPRIIREGIEKHPQTRMDRAHFTAYLPTGLNFQYVYYVRTADYTLYMDIQQAINLHLHERFEQEGIEFATQTPAFYVEKIAKAA